MLKQQIKKLTLPIILTVLRPFSKRINHIYCPLIQSKWFSLLQRYRLIDKKRISLSPQFIFFQDKPICYELINLHSFESIFDTKVLVNTSRIRRAKEKNVRLLYDLSGEALTFDGETNEHWLFFLTTLQAAGIPANSVYLLCSNYKAADYYEEWAQQNKPDYKIHVIGNHFWLFLFSYKFNHYHHSSNNKQKLIQAAERTVLLNERRPHYFICLNLKARLHRIALILFFMQRNYLTKGIITYYGRSSFFPKSTGDKSERTTFSPAILDYLNKLPKSDQLIANLDELEKIRPMTYDRMANFSFNLSWPLPQMIAEFGIYGEIKQFDTYVEIVTETYLSDNRTLFITEKTLKPLLRFQIFIIVGCPHTLKYLKSIGFQTFSPFIDESYDDISDPHERLAAIFKEIDKLCSMSIDELHQLYCLLWPRILHNFEHFTGGMRDVVAEEAKRVLDALG